MATDASYVSQQLDAEARAGIESAPVRGTEDLSGAPDVLRDIWKPVLGMPRRLCDGQERKRYC